MTDQKCGTCGKPFCDMNTEGKSPCYEVETEGDGLFCHGHHDTGAGEDTAIWEVELRKRSQNAVMSMGLVIGTEDAILYFRQLLDDLRLKQEARSQAVKTLLPFVNDHNEVVRWLRGQDPESVADALADVIRSVESAAFAKGKEEQAKDLNLAKVWEDGYDAAFFGKGHNNPYEKPL